jgi:peroxiredoxin
MVSFKANLPRTDNKIIIYSLPQLFTGSTWEQLQSYESAWPSLQAAGIDSMYCINSNNQSRLLEYYAGKFSANTQAIQDLDQQVVASIKEYYAIEKDLHSLSKYWQYVLLIDCGTPVKLFSNPIKENMPLRIVKSRRYQYHGVGPDSVLKYLTTPPETSKM